MPEYHIVSNGSVTSNTAVVVSEIFKSPTTESVVDLDHATVVKGTAGIRYRTVDSAPREGEQKIVRKVESRRSTTLSPRFKLVFLSVLALTILAAIGAFVHAAWFRSPTPNQQNVFEALEFTWKAGLGAILGLLGGKVT